MKDSPTKNDQRKTVNGKLKRLSVVLATKNEERNIDKCLTSIEQIADEIIIYDEFSTDNTREIAKKYEAKIYKYQHKTNFHETKQKAIEKAKGDWILQLDADEVVTPGLADEIMEVVNSSNNDLLKRTVPFRTTENGKLSIKKAELFHRYQKLIEQRDGNVGTDKGEVVAFFIPRKNIFFGKPMVHGGVYPDAVIRLFRKGKAYLPARSVHELPKVDGKVGWLFNDLLHFDSPTFTRYFSRWQRYTDLIADEFKLKFKSKKNPLNFVKYMIIKPVTEFFLLYIRHKGVLDGYRGLIWSFFSALRFPVSYIKYLQKMKS